MAYFLGTRSKKNLKGVHPDLVRIVERAIKLSEVDFLVIEGLRTLATQKKYVAQGASKTLNSQHLKQPSGYGEAVDLAAWVAGKVRWEWSLIFKIAVAMDLAATQLGLSHRLRWGGVWDRKMSEYGGSAEKLKAETEAYQKRHPGPDFLDGVHFEYV